MFTANDIPILLELIDRPAFCVVDGVIQYANRAALGRLVPLGAQIQTLLDTAQEEYETFSDGCLYLSVAIGGTYTGACVRKIAQTTMFLLDTEEDDPALRAYALAAKALREPLNEALAIADCLPADAQTPRLIRSLYRLLRLVGNMSDSAGLPFHPEMRNVTAVMQELFDLAAMLCAHAGIRLEFSNYPAPVYSVIDSDLLERGIYSLLSNAMKYAGTGGTITAQLSRQKNTLFLSILHSGTSPEPGGDPLRSYQREPGIEDSRNGIGLGLLMARSVAAAHHGTLLLDHPHGQGTRAILGLPICQNSSLCSPVQTIDSTGQRDPRLVELSEVLPPELYSGKF